MRPLAAAQLQQPLSDGSRARRCQLHHMHMRLAPFIRGARLCSRLLDSASSRPLLRHATALDMADMQKAIVKSLPNEPNLVISLSLAGKLRNLDRPKDEPLEKPLQRIQKSAAPQPDKRQKRQQQQQRPPPPPQAGGSGPGEAQAAPSAAATAAAAVVLHAGPTADTPALDAAAVSNAEAWQHGRLLRVGGELFRVELNPPIVDRLEVPPGAFAGVPLYPLLASHFTEEDACAWRWFRRPAGVLPRRGAAAAAAAAAAEEEEGWQEIPGATQRRYVPGPEDVGCLLRVECTPGRRRGSPAAAPAALCDPPPAAPADGGAAAAAGPPQRVAFGEPAAATAGPVAAPPAPLGAAPRLAAAAQRAAAPEFRVVTYNILADQYASTETARRVLFKHCPPECLVPEYRRPLVLAELLGLQGDVMCLQEVDDKMFTQLLQPQLGAVGYQGAYTNKAGKVREGSALFWRADRFQPVAQRDLALKDFFPPSPDTPSRYGAVFAPMLRSSPQLLHALQRIGTVAQLALLAPTAAEAAASGGCSRPLLVANTHLFYHYMAPHIRTMHTWVMMQEAQRFMEEAAADPALAPQLAGASPTLLFCGDLNSDLNDGTPGAVELLAKGRLAADFWDWAFGVPFKWGTGAEEDGEGAGAATSSGEYGEVSKMVHGSVEHAHPSPPGSPQEIVPGVELSLPFRLAPADGLRTPFTNYVKGYQGLLDYIWYSPGEVEVSREIPLPSLPELGGYLPSPRFPSDHLPVVFDLRFRPAQQAQQQQGAGGEALGAVAAAGDGSSSSLGPSGGAAPGQPGASGSGGAAGGGSSSSGGGSGGGGGADNVYPAAMHHVGLAVEAIQAGHVIAVPTDTLYGLATCASTPEGVAAIYDAKRRQLTKPLAICVADPWDVARYAHVEHLAKGMVEDLLPGPVTLLLARRADAPLAAELNPGVGSIGVRVPDYPFIRAICRQHRGALALTSANISQGLSPQRVMEFEELWPACEAVFDGGELSAGRAGSTVLDLTRPGVFRVTRRGAGFAATVKLLTEKYGLVHEVLAEE